MFIELFDHKASLGRGGASVVVYCVYLLARTVVFKFWAAALPIQLPVNVPNKAIEYGPSVKTRPPVHSSSACMY